MRETTLKYFFVGPDGGRANPIGREAFMRIGRQWDQKYGKKNWTVLDRCELVEPQHSHQELQHVDANQTA